MQKNSTKKLREKDAKTKKNHNNQNIEKKTQKTKKKKIHNKQNIDEQKMKTILKKFRGYKKKNMFVNDFSKQL